MSAESNYLERIIPAVRRRLAERRSRIPQAELEAMCGDRDRPSFAAAVGAPGMSLIAEVKRASPSRGPIRLDLDVGRVVRDYTKAGAKAVSVLTEEDFFRGSLADLGSAAEHTSLPLLRKDFVVDPYQIHEARAYGASAILLIVALLDERQLEEFARLAGEAGLDVLVEVHDATEMARALAIEGDGVVIGVNNRDLKTFTVSLETTVHLASLVPDGHLVVSESGVRTRKDIEKLAALGIDAVLVGESLLAKADVEMAVRELMGPALAEVTGSGESSLRGEDR